MLDSGVYDALNGLLKIVIYSLYVASPLIILILLMYGYERYKKWKSVEVKEKERIIVKMNKDIKDDALTCDTLNNNKTQLQLDVEKLKKEKQDLQIELGKPEEIEVNDQVDFKVLNIKELKALAKQKGIKRYSKMNKELLLEVLGNQ